jgi:hypothetical protein
MPFTQSAQTSASLMDGKMDLIIHRFTEVSNMTSRNCLNGEHMHCGGQLKFANADNTDDCIPCDCGCHPASKEEQDAGIFRDPRTGWAIRKD